MWQTPSTQRQLRVFGHRGRAIVDVSLAGERRVWEVVAPGGQPSGGRGR